MGYTHIFYIRQPSGTSGDAVRYKVEAEIQDGGHQTGNGYTSTNKIPEEFLGF